MRELTGIYRAIVTDTSCFRETGKIKTRISIFNNFYVERDLLDNYNKDKYEESIVDDRLTFIMTPYGGGYNCGMFALPQINSQGLVSFIDGNPELPIWVGALNSIDTKGDFLEHSDIPSDNLFQEKSSVDFDSETKETQRNVDDRNSFIIRTKTNEFDQDDLINYNKINWKSSETENGLVMSRKHFQAVHKNDSSNFSSLTMSNDIDYPIELSHKIIEENSVDEKGVVDESSISEKSSVNLGKKGVVLLYKNGESESILQTGEKIRLILKKGNLETEIYQDEKMIKIKNNDCVIELEQKASGLNEIKISSPVVRIDSKEIYLGAGGNRVVTSSDDFTMSLEDGTILSSSQNVRL